MVQHKRLAKKHTTLSFPLPCQSLDIITMVREAQYCKQQWRADQTTPLPHIKTELQAF